MSKLLTCGLEERLKEVLGHNTKVDDAPFLFKAKKINKYCKILHSLWFIQPGISYKCWSVLHQYTPIFPFPLSQDTQKL